MGEKKQPTQPAPAKNKNEEQKTENEKIMERLEYFNKLDEKGKNERDN
jgi:hypothetical protein